jgi:hypothetical protein
LPQQPCGFQPAPFQLVEITDPLCSCHRDLLSGGTRSHPNTVLDNCHSII